MKGSKVWGGQGKGDNNGTTKCHYHHYSSMKFSKSPRFYEDLPCLKILGEVWNIGIKGFNSNLFFDFSFFW
jgi:hypothetical protein